jgi:hypothetical protein
MNSLCTLQGVCLRKAATVTITTTSTSSDIVSNYSMFVKFGTSTIPTSAGTYTITNNYSTATNNLTMVIDSTRGYVLYCKGTGVSAILGTVGYLTTSYTFSSSFSVCQWVKLITLTGNQVSWAMGDAVSYMQPSSGQLCGGGRATTSFTPLTDTWYHYVSTYDGTTEKLYVNGAFYASFTSSISSSSNIFYISSYPLGSYGLNGYIDNFRYYKRVITEAEVATIYAFENSNPTL